MPINPKSTYVGDWNATYQRQLPSNWMASVSYLGNHTDHLWIALERNPAVSLPGVCQAGQPFGSTLTLPACTTSNTNQRRILYQANPTAGIYYASIDSMDDGATARYQGLLLSTQHRSNHYTFIANFTDCIACRITISARRWPVPPTRRSLIATPIGVPAFLTRVTCSTRRSSPPATGIAATTSRARC
jgi:hypothetical protein